MSKIVFVTLPMQPIEGAHWDPDGYIYKCKDNPKIEYKNKVKFAVDGFLAKTLRKDEEVTIVRILIDAGNSETNAKKQKDELDKINETIEADIRYEEIKTAFDDSGRTIEKRFRDIIGHLKDDCEIVLDITYGSKTLIPVLFYVLGFAEKFFNADIKNILYDKTEFTKFSDGQSAPIPDSCELFDVTSLYYLNSLTSIMQAPDSKTALKRLDNFFAL
ncbi:MAG: hypothetical protein J6X78_06775 [Treponema sp.]|nr:hypothetical protein [Treponema sp.]